jgi:hypothetical protein
MRVRTNDPLSQKTIVSAKQILRYKNVKSFGEQRWDMLGNISQEMEKLGKIRINVRDGQSKKDAPTTYQSSLMVGKPVKREFNRYTKHYVTSSWEIRPGNRAAYMMSKK